MAAEPLQTQEFSALIEDRFSDALKGHASFAVGLSGGPDSMVLAKFLSGWAVQRGNTTIHAITVDHGLRPESADEAAKVGEWVKDWPHIKHVILRWEGDKPQNRIQEEARGARYELMGKYCADAGIRHIFLGHHQDDQAETFLMRLAMGSGLDGLAAMRASQDYGTNLTLWRPLLAIPKERLLASAEAMSVPFVNDPSNKSDNFARVRLRKSVVALEAEGLSSKRLAVTAERLDRARQTLDIIAEKSAAAALIQKSADRIVYKYDALLEWPEEIVLRVLIGAMKALRPPGDYLPRMEKIESLFGDLMKPEAFTKRTLGGLIFERDDGASSFTVSIENKEKAPGS